jgi:hypothetical protein
MKTTTIKEVAQEMLNHMKTGKRDSSGESYVYLEISAPEWMRDIAYKAHGNRVPDDYIWQYIQDALEIITEVDDDASEEEVRDQFYEIEADIYTSSLTEWLGSNVSNVYYLTEVLEEMEIKDGFQLLAVAQQKQRQEVAEAVLQGICERINEVSNA